MCRCVIFNVHNVQELEENIDSVLAVLVDSVIEEALRDLMIEEEIQNLRQEHVSLSKARAEDVIRIEELEERVKSVRREKVRL